MKTIFTLSITFLFLTIGRAQVINITPLYNNPDYGNIENAYYKDINNDLDNFTGTWQYTNGTTSFTLTLQKKVQQYNPYSHFYSDVLVGGYQYIENGEEKINTLAQLNTDYDNYYTYHVVGNIINLASNFPICWECDPNQKRVILDFEDPTRNNIEGLYGEIVVRRVDEGGVQKIEVRLIETGNIIINNGIPPAYTSFNVPFGTYVMTKVE